MNQIQGQGINVGPGKLGKKNVRHGKFAQKNKRKIWKYGYPMEKIIKWNNRRDFNKNVGPKLINVGPSFIPHYRIGIDYSSIVDPRPLRNCDVIYGWSPYTFSTDGVVWLNISTTIKSHFGNGLCQKLQNEISHRKRSELHSESLTDFCQKWYFVRGHSTSTCTEFSTFFPLDAYVV